MPWPAFCFAFALAAAAGCGKKGPPLAPLVIQPAAPTPAAVRARGDEAAFQFRVPDANADSTRPADVARVEVYGYTGQPASDEELLERGTRVATVRVQPPRDPEEQGSGKEAGPPPGAVLQGDVVVVTERLGPAQRVPSGDASKEEKKPLPPPPEIAGALQPPALSALPRRLYAAVAVSRRGRRGPFSEKHPVPLVDPPAAPPAPRASHDEKAVLLEWTAAAGVLAPTLRPAGEKDDVLRAKAIGMPLLDGGYNVYLVETPPDEAPASGEGAGASKGPLPAPLNAALLSEPTFADPAVEFGTERCYVVRAVSVFGQLVVESEASPVTCITPADTFAPARPGGLAAVASEGSISLIWEGVTDADLQGYLVLRAEAGGEPQPVTPEPISETTYRDTRVKAGVRYTYAVVAVDRAGNRSEPSVRVDETAR